MCLFLTKNPVSTIICVCKMKLWEQISFHFALHKECIKITFKVLQVNFKKGLSHLNNIYKALSVEKTDAEIRVRG